MEGHVIERARVEWRVLAPGAEAVIAKDDDECLVQAALFAQRIAKFAHHPVQFPEERNAGATGLFPGTGLVDARPGPVRKLRIERVEVALVFVDRSRDAFLER